MTFLWTKSTQKQELEEVHACEHSVFHLRLRSWFECTWHVPLELTDVLTAPPVFCCPHAQTEHRTFWGELDLILSVCACVCVCMCRFAPSTCGCLGIIVLVSYMSVCSNSAALPEENEVETRRTMFDECAQTKTSGRQVVVHSPEECLNLTNIPWPLRRIIAPNFCFLCNKQNESDWSVLLHTRHQRRDVSTSKDCNGGSHHLSAVGKESRPVLARCKSVMSVRECDSQYRHSPSLSWPGFTGNTHPPVYTRKSTETPRLSFFPLSF